MNESVTIPLQFNTVLVSRYKAFPALAAQLGYAQPDAPFYECPHPEDLRGMDVITDSLALRLACFAHSVTVVPLALPEDIDTTSAGWEVLAAHMSPPSTYVVSPCSREMGHQYSGGTTALATRLARIAAAGGLSEDELATAFDRAMWDERVAGMESEKLLLKALTAERDRRIRAEESLPRAKASLENIRPGASLAYEQVPEQSGQS